MDAVGAPDAEGVLVLQRQPAERGGEGGLLGEQQLARGWMASARPVSSTSDEVIP